jgi:hypothetical protein
MPRRDDNVSLAMATGSVSMSLSLMLSEAVSMCDIMTLDTVAVAVVRDHYSVSLAMVMESLSLTECCIDGGDGVDKPQGAVPLAFALSRLVRPRACHSHAQGWWLWCCCRCGGVRSMITS